MTRSVLFSCLFAGCVLVGSTACEQNKPKPAPAKEEVAKDAKPAADEKKPEAPATEPAAEAKSAEGGGDVPDFVKESRKYGHVPIVGNTEPAKVQEKFDLWKKATDKAVADEAVSKKLAEVKEGAVVTVVFGTWCSDCYRELPQMWKALEKAGKTPFTIQYIAIDEQFTAGDVNIHPYNITNIPTIIVQREGAEVGRIIEMPEQAIEKDLLALLDGSKKGTLTKSPQLRKNLGLKPLTP